MIISKKHTFYLILKNYKYSAIIHQLVRYWTLQSVEKIPSPLSLSSKLVSWRLQPVAAISENLSALPTPTQTLKWPLWKEWWRGRRCGSQPLSFSRGTLGQREPSPAPRGERRQINAEALIFQMKTYYCSPAPPLSYPPIPPHPPSLSLSSPLSLSLSLSG